VIAGLHHFFVFAGHIPIIPLGNVPPGLSRSRLLDHSSSISLWTSAGTASGRSSDTFTV
jgi:hypothetical protein